MHVRADGLKWKLQTQRKVHAVHPTHKDLRLRCVGFVKELMSARHRPTVSLKLATEGRELMNPLDGDVDA